LARATATERIQVVIAKIPGGDKILASPEKLSFCLAIASFIRIRPTDVEMGSVVIAAEDSLEIRIQGLNGKQPPVCENRGLSAQIHEE